MNTTLEVFLFIISGLLGIIGVFLSRILNRLTSYEEKQHSNSINIALNTQAIAELKKVA